MSAADGSRMAYRARKDRCATPSRGCCPPGRNRKPTAPATGGHRRAAVIRWSCSSLTWMRSGIASTRSAPTARSRSRQRGGFFPSFYRSESPRLVHAPKGDVVGVFLSRDSGSAADPHAAAALAWVSAPPSRRSHGRPGSPPDRRSRCRSSTGGSQARAQPDGRSMTGWAIASLILGTASRSHQAARRRSRSSAARAKRSASRAREAAAAALATATARVHAVDTFVSADSPLETPTFAVAPIGQRRRGPGARQLAP